MIRRGRHFLQIPGPTNTPDRILRAMADFNELMLIGTLGGVELGLGAAGVPFTRGGVDAALALLSQRATVESTAAVSGR